MSDQQQFEVYPPAAEAGIPAPEANPPASGTQTWEQPSTELPVQDYPVTPYRAPDVVPPPPQGSGTSRRGVIGLVVALPVAGIILASLNRAADSDANQYDGDPTDDADDPDDNNGYDPDTDGGSTDGSIEVGGYSADLPEGWDVDSDDGDQVVVTNGANRLVAYSFEADESDQAADLITALVKRRRGGFTGTLGTPDDASDDEVQRATVSASGTFSKKPARLKGRLWIDGDGAALLVVQVLTAKQGSAIAREAETIAKDLSTDFG